MLSVLGPLKIAVPGTPQRVTSILPLNTGGLVNDRAAFTCHAVLLQALWNNTGKVYIGTADMVKATLAGVSAVLAIPTANAIPGYSISLTLAPSGVDLSTLWVDADQANEGLLVTILQT